MNDTNEEIVQNLKCAIHDYYMGYIKQKFKNLLANGKETEISSQIMQFLDAQIDTNNSVIVRDDITRILNTVLLEDTLDPFASNLWKTQISHCFPDFSTVTIKQGEAAYLNEKIQTPLNGVEEHSYYLYVSPDYYNNNIRRYRI